MTRALFAIMAAVVLAGSTGCCCMDRLFATGCGPTWGGGGCGGGDSCGGEMGGCDSCGHGGHGGHLGHHGLGQGRLLGRHGCKNSGDGYAGYAGPAGPPTGAVTYPYYTNRGPRDFLVNNPPSIGP